ncbi:oxysterol-binding protein-related protein 8 isoform X1 [Callorhinchus milii]|uniref:oxysterol-binding protein-related protein 8 isoform X1 n=2 Tax=Callorhinchus milii TaxID=7868 RepID=UPI00045734E3|nr:oxysterol-binding protein-related protein 8 isoform X1 [Callorhinchus milii]|eukprot:gi/632955587/ref/XP_007893537.1/ PREDICTED: oxysterol-binding protein-related protein 8 isoform X1 [Callorhinchus milii]
MEAVITDGENEKRVLGNGGKRGTQRIESKTLKWSSKVRRNRFKFKKRGQHHGEIRDLQGLPTVFVNNDESESLPVTPGKMSLRQGKEALHPQTKELIHSTLSPGIGGNHGLDRGKDDVSMAKDDLTYSISKSKSESKLYNGTERDLASPGSKLTKKESLKVQKKNYREEKKRATKELLSTITDPSVIVMADWLKIRGTLKSWTKLWCVLKPGVLLIYKTPKNGQWVGTVLLNACELIERPSKKDGFCFKVFHPLEQSVWAVKGPKGEAVGSITQPLPGSYLIFRAASESDGRCWMDALELALKCSGLLKRTMMREGKELDLNASLENSHVALFGLLRANVLQSSEHYQLNDSEIEQQHFRDHDLYSDKSDKENEQDHEESDNDGLEKSGKSEESDSDTSEKQDDSFVDPEPMDLIKETTYVEESHEELGEAGEACQTEVVSEENKSLIWTLLKQVRPGMDLSKVVLPTFILEPRSFLDKLSDYYYHADFLSEAAVEENAYSRMKKVVKWYLSGFYKKPKGLKKPYNPIIGETFRCMWIHPKTNSRTFYISEQVSHHPPISAFYVSNRKDGFCVSGSILAKSKFYGNSLSAILDGEARLSFLSRGEDYIMTIPYAHCKGILYGTLTLELGGYVNISCEKTGYSAIIEFKLKPFLGSNDSVNQIAGKIKLGSEVLATLEGHWDTEVIINDKKTNKSELFWNPTIDIRQQRLTRCTVLFEEQENVESEKLWQHVTRAISHKDQNEATNEKFILEEAQRNAAKERKAKKTEWFCKLFEQDPITGDWHYKYADTRPWDPLNDLMQYEKDGVIQSKVWHRTPMVRSGSVISLSNQVGRKENCKRQVAVPKRPRNKHSGQRIPESGCSTPEQDQQDSSESERQKTAKHSTRLRKKVNDLGELQSAIDSIRQTQEEINRCLTVLRGRTLASQSNSDNYFLQLRDYVIIFLLILIQIVVNYLFK